jgi:hypothetical protein
MTRIYFLMAGICMAAVLPVEARKILVGPTRTYTSPCEAESAVQPGDTVEIDAGVYPDQACTWDVSNTVIRGVSEFAHLQAPAVIPNQKAILVISGDNTVVENIEFSDASVPDQNGAGIRQEGENLTIRHCYFHDCEDGILGGGGGQSRVLIEYSEFADCGYGDGYSHNMYISNVAEFTLRFCYTHSASEGHTIKSRAQVNYILYNRIASENSTTSYEVNLPNAGTSFIIGNLIQQGSNSHNSAIIDYGSEGLDGHDDALHVVNNTVVNDRGSGTFISISNTSNPAKVYNNLFVGSGSLYGGQVDTAGNIATDAPAFADRENYDYRLTEASPGIDQGTDPGSVDGFSLIPEFQYVHNSLGESRTLSGSALDVGAYEFADPSAIQLPASGLLRSMPTTSLGQNPDYDLRGRMIKKNGKNNYGRHSGLWLLGPVISIRHD